MMEKELCIRCGKPTSYDLNIEGDYIVRRVDEADGDYHYELELITAIVEDNLFADIDKDGTPATPADAMYLARYLAGWEGYDVDISVADLDGDNAVTIRDAIILARYIAKWPGYETLPYRP